jgi:DNA processing protein
MNRSVMAVPGRVGDKASAGCLNLIREGARMVTCAEDIIEELTPIGSSKRSQRDGRTAKKAVKAAQGEMSSEQEVKKVESQITIEESVAMGAIDGETSVDALARKTGIPIGKLMPLLVSLRLKGRIKFLPGNRVVSSD